MRATELLECEVVDARGRRLGPVRDVRLWWDRVPAPGGGSGSEFRVAGIVVGDGLLAAIAHAWGFAEGRALGPWPIRRALRRAIRRARFVPIDQVRSIAPGEVALRCEAGALVPLEQELTRDQD